MHWALPAQKPCHLSSPGLLPSRQQHLKGPLHDPCTMSPNFRKRVSLERRGMRNRVPGVIFHAVPRWSDANRGRRTPQLQLITYTDYQKPYDLRSIWLVTPRGHGSRIEDLSRALAYSLYRNPENHDVVCSSYELQSYCRTIDFT